MKILKLNVSGLFDTFKHSIPFTTEGITLILGQNGLGKTVMLNIIQHILSGNFQKLNDIHFSEIEVFFDNNIIWRISKSIVSLEENLNIALIENGELRHSISLNDIFTSNNRLKNILRKYLPPNIARVEEDEWVDRHSGVKYSALELYSKYKSILPNDLFGEYTVFPEWISSITDKQEIAFIETQRLLTFYTSVNEYSRKSSTYKNTVEEYSEVLSKEINLQLANSSELATKLDRTYPNRLIERLTKTSNISQQQLNTKLEELEGKRSRLQKVGLLDLEKEPKIDFIQEQDSTIRDVLLVYIEDSRKKLEVYDVLADKIELFLKIINERFLQKKLSISKEEGFHFESLKTGKKIPINSLSSGEQHLLILYYKLLFILKRGTLLLMDEPEISLHISWQKKIIPDILNILKLNPMTVIIATHSPAVIGKNWHLTVELTA